MDQKDRIVISIDGKRREIDVSELTLICGNGHPHDIRVETEGWERIDPERCLTFSKLITNRTYELTLELTHVPKLFEIVFPGVSLPGSAQALRQSPAAFRHVFGMICLLVAFQVAATNLRLTDTYRARHTPTTSRGRPANLSLYDRVFAVNNAAEFTDEPANLDGAGAHAPPDAA